MQRVARSPSSLTSSNSRRSALETERAGRTDLHAAGTETAPRLDQGRRLRADDGLAALVEDEAKRIDLPYIAAHANAA
jgi:hypothetical protein